MPNNDDKETLLLLRSISDKADQTKDAVSAIDKKLDLHIQRTEFELARINTLDQQQNKLLDEHIAGVNTLKEWCDLHERANNERFQKIEEPKRLFGLAKNIAVWVASVATAVTVIVELLSRLK